MERTSPLERGQPGRGEGLQLAIERSGGVAALARGLGISQPSVSAWKRIPADRVVAVEALTGIGRANLRPDLYSAPADTAHPPNEGYARDIVDEIDQARARHYLLLATLLTKAPSQALLTQLAMMTGDHTPLGRAHAALARAAGNTDQDRAGREFFDLFVGVGRGDVLPYASFYRTGFLNGRPLAQVRADLARLGFERDERVFEPEDHLGTLLEVMAQLILDRDVPEGDTLGAGHTAAADFFKKHIEGWAERAFEDIALAPSAAFYRAVAETGRLWLEIETEAFALPA